MTGLPGSAGPEAASYVTVICDQLRILGTGLDEAVLTGIVEQSVPKPFQRRQVADDLTRSPELLTGQGASGSPRVLALIEALVAHGARCVSRPACPFCHRSVPLKFRRNRSRCCRRCYDAARLRPCSSCGRQQSVATRTPDGQPLCGQCMRRDPLRHEVCVRCGRLAVAVRHDESGGAVCKRCWRPPMATCSVCGKHKPCARADSATPRCLSCQRIQNQAPCSRCGRVRTVWGRTNDGEPLCGSCGRPSEPCLTCGRLRKVTGRTANGQPLCRTCYRKHPVSFRSCTECGTVEHLHHRGLCTRCAAPRQLRTALARPDGSVRPDLEPVITALARSQSYRLLVWLRDGGGRGLLAELAAGPGPLNHASLDDLPPSKALAHFRAILVAAGALPERDENLAQFEQWLDGALMGIEAVDDRRLLQSYATWFHLHRLRRRSARRPLTPNQIHPIRHEIRSAIRLLAWLRARGTSLNSSSQSDIDQWLTSDQPGRHTVGSFVAWAVEHGHAHAVVVPACPGGDDRGQALLPEVDQRWTLSKRLLHDSTLPTVDRVAGCLVLLYGQPCSCIVGLTTADVSHTAESMRLRLGSTPVDIREPLGTLLGELVRVRQGHAVVEHTDNSAWLIPGGRPGRPMSAHHLAHRLNRLGIPTRAARGSALMDLARRLPAIVVARLLGLHPNTATAWAQEAGNTRPSYAAQVARRAREETRANP